MANIIGDTVVRILVDANEFAKGIDKVGKKYQDLGKLLDKTGKSLTVGITAPLVAAGVGLVKLAKKAGETADRLLDLEQITGLSTNTLQEFKNVAAVAGVDFESLVGSLTKFSARIDEIDKGGGPAAEAVRKLGINIRDANGNIKSADQLFPEFISGLSKVQNVTERNALAQNIFGRSLESLAPVLSLTTEQIEAAREEAYKLGVVQSKDALEAADTYRQMLDQLKLSIEGQATAIGTELIPLLSQMVPIVADVARSVLNLVKGFASLPVETQKFILAAAGIAAAIGPVLIGVGKLITVLPALIAGIKGVAAAFQLSVSGFGLATTAIIAVAAAIAAVIINTVKARKEAKELQYVTENLAEATTDQLEKAYTTLGEQIVDLDKRYNEAIETLKKYKQEQQNVTNAQAKAYGQLGIQKQEEAIARMEKELNLLKAQRAAIEERIKQEKADAEAAAKKAQAEAEAAAKKRADEEEARKAEQDALEIEKARAKAAQELYDKLLRIDQLTKVGALTEIEGLEEKIRLREEEIARIQAAAINGEIGATAALKLIQIQKKQLESYYERLKELEAERREDIKNTSAKQNQLNAEITSNAEKNADIQLEHTKKRSAERIKLSEDEAKQIESIIRGTTSVLNSSSEDIASNFAGAIASVAQQFGQVEIAAAALIVQATLELGKALSQIFKANEEREQERVAIARQANQQILANQTDTLKQQQDASKAYYDEQFALIERNKQAELEALGLADKSKAEQLRTDIANAERRGEFAKKKKLEEEVAKAEIEEKYAKQAEELRAKQAADEAAFAKENRRLVREKAILDKEITIAQMEMQKRKALSELPWYTSPGDKFKLEVEYDNLIKAARAIPIPNLATGGIVQPKPGGTLARIAEAGVPEIVGPIDKVTTMLNSMGAGLNGLGDNVHLVVQLDSKPILDKIFPATKNRTVLISAASVV